MNTKNKLMIDGGEWVVIYVKNKKSINRLKTFTYKKVMRM